jgi:hypothetical protein
VQNSKLFNLRIFSSLLFLESAIFFLFSLFSDIPFSLPSLSSPIGSIDAQKPQTMYQKAASFGMKTARGTDLQNLCQYLHQLRTAIKSSPWDGFDDWVAVNGVLAKQHGAPAGEVLSTFRSFSLFSSPARTLTALPCLSCLSCLSCLLKSPFRKLVRKHPTC